MFTENQRTQLVLLVNRAFTAQLEYSNKKQSRNMSPTLRSVTSRTPTPIPANSPANSPIKFWAESFDHLLEAGDRFRNSVERAAAPSMDEINVLKEKARALKNEYREYYMQISGDTSPEQANALYQTAQKEAENIYKAAYNDSDRDASEDAKAQFVLSFTIALMSIAPIARSESTSESSIETNDVPEPEASLAGLDNTFSTLSISR